jgi:phage shock protein A
MALLERVSTLLRANINDLLLQAEDPGKLARQLVLDMENQLMQIKTEVAMAIADQHLLQKQRSEQHEAHAQWLRKAELAVSKEQDDLARAALERSLSHKRRADGLDQQYANQTIEAEALRVAYSRLQLKLSETQARVDSLSARLRRSRAAQRIAAVQAPLNSNTVRSRIARFTSVVDESESSQQALRILRTEESAEDIERRFESLEQSDQIEALLSGLKERQHRLS